ncbi:TPA: hypothetical protein ACH3X1_014857 [Trebouxia sp. C0004]
MRVVVTANALVWNFLCMPHVPQDNATMKQAWEQEFAWTEAEKPVKMAAKALMVGGSQNLSQQSIFCFETLTHMLYWSSIVYDYKRVWEQEFAWIEVDKPVIASMSISWSDLQVSTESSTVILNANHAAVQTCSLGAIDDIYRVVSKQELQESAQGAVEVWCYSFGAPRTGNHAFAHHYYHRVPDTWSIINDQDVATRGGEFVFLYKRPGHRVIANNAGHMMVSPSSIEASVQQSRSKGLFPLGLAHQDLQETQMVMRLGEMQQVAQLSPEFRQGLTLPQAHLPAQGFYNIRESMAAKSRKQSAPWFRLFGVPAWLTPWLASCNSELGMADTSHGR